MEALLEFLKAGDIVIGILATIFAGLMGAFVWWDKRTRIYTDDRVEGVRETNLRVVERLTAVEGDLRRVDEEIGEMKTTIAQLPKSQDIVDLRVSMADMAATMRQMQGLVRTLYEAAVRASERPS